ncbi:AAEL011867-PA [Aedes aegypti]|uniref:AAEL011867-PA n=1 Tax=Aedes aegypti TaxID=7159 RepID=Q16NT2_AEDAE|nr:AAEL011867-PA [Aedes aegypti]
MSFCRITGKCRSLPKPNYFPMLPPISPADAKRFCRVTGKSYGLPSHHYIPVMLIKSSGKTKCKVTNVSDQLDPHHYFPGNYGSRKHTVVCQFRYVFPILDDQDDAQKNLTNILVQKTKSIEQSLYVYKVDERNFGLVFPAKLEAAVRDGDVRDVMLAKESDKLLIKLKKGNSIAVSLKNVEQCDLENLYEGEGPREDVIKKREIEDAKRPKPKGKSNLSSIANIFEEKEKIQDLKDEEEQKFIEAHREKAVRLAEERRERQLEEKLNALKLNEHLIEQDPELNDLVKPMIESWDWSTLEKEASDSTTTANSIKTLPEPHQITPVNLPPKHLQVDHAILEKSSGMEAASYVGAITPAKIELKSERLNVMKSLPPDLLDALAHVEEKLASQADLLPHLDDLASVITRLQDAQPIEVDGVPGVKLVVNHQEIFIPGQTLAINNKSTFIPGQTVETDNGLLEFVPGVTITSHDSGSIQFIPGEVALTKAGKPQCFVAGKVIDGKFVCGQVLTINDEPQFVQGQTIVTPEGVSKFVAGVVDEKTGEFVPGQNIQTPDGVKFVPGQTITVNGKEKFIPGQTVVKNNKEMVFVPGQTVVNEKGESKFVPGKTIVTAEGSKFVPGQYVEDMFVPGISDGEKFVPGVNIETKEGSKFVQGQIVHTKHGDVFMPGSTTVNEKGQIRFELASTIEAVKFSEATPVGMVMDSENMKITEPALCVFGHMVQQETGVEFYPEKIKKEDLPQGKIVPGKLVKQLAQTKFIPGINVEEGFIPGQVVQTDHGEQFVPGQVIETSEGLKFVPGQIVETKNGAKFVPGQTMQTADGPRFVPGQIINTKAGPTFIPGQVICTDDDGEKFVPGQVVDTDDGPRFVPGRVVETDNKVTFIPGRIVQTAEGPKFVAPDLKDTEDGDEEFLVQSFAVTPEELKLLKPTQNSATIDTPESSVIMTLDSSMLQQLSEAGMNIGRQVEASAVDYVLESTKERKALQQFIAEHNIQNGSMDVLENLFDGLKAVCKRVDLDSLQYGLEDDKLVDTSVCNGSIGAVESLATNLATILANTSESENCNMYEVIAEAIKMSNGEYSIEELQHVMESAAAVDYLAGVVNKTIVKNNIDQKLKTITALVGEDDEGREVSVAPPKGAIEEFCQLMDNDRMSEAFVNLLKKDENLFKSIVSGLKTTGVVEGSVNISEILQAAVVDSIQEKALTAIMDLLNEPNREQLNSLLKKSECLAMALGNSKEAEAFEYLLTHPQALKDLNKEDELFTIINRVLIMEELAEDDDEYRELIDSLEKTPSHATKSDKLRELIRQSGALSFAPAKKHTIESSKDVPLSLFYTNNQLAIEEFFLKSGQHQRHCPKAFLIIKRGIQAVIPRESSHEVLAGKIAYTVLDEHGIHQFQPMNVLNALKITPRFLNRFSMYTCDICEEPDLDTLSSSSSHGDGDVDSEGHYYSPRRPLSRKGSLYNSSSARRADRLDSPIRYHHQRPPTGTTTMPNGYHERYAHHVENMKTLPMAMRIAIKASISREAPIIKSSSRDYLHRSSSYSRLK